MTADLFAKLAAIDAEIRETDLAIVALSRRIAALQHENDAEIMALRRVLSELDDAIERVQRGLR